MIPHAYLVHGFNDRGEGKTTVDLLADSLRVLGYEPVQWDYLWQGRLGVRFCNRPMASALAHSAQPGDIAIGHSNGCAILHLATHHADNPAPFSRMVYVNPALDAAAPLAGQVKDLAVFHDPTDIWPRIAAWIPLSPWGSMGTKGATAPDRRIHNHEHHFGHSGLFANDPARIVRVLRGTGH